MHPCLTSRSRILGRWLIVYSTVDTLETDSGPSLSDATRHSVTLMLVLHRVRVLRRVTPKTCYANIFQRGLATGAGLLGELTSRGFIFQVTK